MPTLLSFLGIGGKDSMEIAFESFKNDNKRKKPILIAWIHSHVGSIKCNFSSIDLHTHHSLSKMHDGILGLVIEINENGKVSAHDFYELSNKGKRSIEICSKGQNCNSRQQHESCSDSTFYQSASRNVKLEGSFHLKVRNFMITTTTSYIKNHMTLDPDDDDFKTADESMHFENVASDRLRKRKISKNSTNKSPSKSDRKKRKVTKRIDCPFCGKGFAESYLVKHIEKIDLICKPDNKMFYFVFDICLNVSILFFF